MFILRNKYPLIVPTPSDRLYKFHLKPNFCWLFKGTLTNKRVKGMVT